MLLAGMLTVSCGMVSASAADIGDSLDWQAIACHETGHAFGLMHSLEGQIMYGELERYFNNSNNWNLYTPTYSDINNLDHIYQDVQ